MLQQLSRASDREEKEFSPIEVLRWLYRHKIALFLCTFIAAGATAGYSLTIPRSYHAVALLRLVTPPESQPSLVGSGLASLSGLTGSLFAANLPTDDTAVTLAYLTSTTFARSFVEDNNLLPELYPTLWDDSRKAWIEMPPSLDAGAANFLGNIRVDRDTRGLVTLEVVWSNAERARAIAEQYIARVNQVRREQSLERAKSNFDYLMERLRRESVQEMRATIANTASRELTLLMLASGPGAYALEEIGPVYAPEFPVGPRRRLMTMIGAVIGFCGCALFILFRQALKS